MNTANKIVDEVKKAIIGKDEVIKDLLAAILAKGHILLDDIPGVGKTTLAVAFAKAMGLSYNRVQFTPDVLPSDIVGYSVFNKEKNSADYVKGAVFTNIFLADEINRATSRTQSALLEAMEERQVTVDGKCHTLSEPFFVIATQNPIGAAGTQLLPDSQMDRFTVCLSLGYPSPDAEREIILNRQGKNPIETVEKVATEEELKELQKKTEEVYIKPELVDYVVRLINATRDNKEILRGASPRGSLALVSMAKANAFLACRDFVIPEDIREVFVKTVSHRILLSPEAEANGVSKAKLLKKITERTVSPKLS